MRTFALSLPETTEEPHFDKSSFRVRGKIFATVPPEGGYVHIHLDPAERAALLESDGSTFEPIGRGAKPAADWIRVTLSGADATQVKELLQEAWRLKAPITLRKRFDGE